MPRIKCPQNKVQRKWDVVYLPDESPHVSMYISLLECTLWKYCTPTMFSIKATLFVILFWLSALNMNGNLPTQFKPHIPRLLRNCSFSVFSTCFTPCISCKNLWLLLLQGYLTKPNFALVETYIWSYNTVSVPTSITQHYHQFIRKPKETQHAGGVDFLIRSVIPMKVVDSLTFYTLENTVHSVSSPEVSTVVTFVFSHKVNVHCFKKPTHF